MGHIPHVYVPLPWAEAELPLTAEADHHLHKVLRMGDGEEVTYTDGHGTMGSGVLRSMSVGRGSERQQPEPSLNLAVAVAPPRDKDRVRFLVEKLAELEVRRLLWLRTRFGVHRLPDRSKALLWIQSALEQSRGAWLMDLGQGWFEPAELSGPVWFADVGANLVTSPKLAALTLAIGPEGGWDAGEIPESATRFGLGRTVLRVESAAIVAAARLLS